MARIGNEMQLIAFSCTEVFLSNAPWCFCVIAGQQRGNYFTMPWEMHKPREYQGLSHKSSAMFAIKMVPKSVWKTGQNEQWHVFLLWVKNLWNCKLGLSEGLTNAQQTAVCWCKRLSAESMAHHGWNLSLHSSDFTKFESKENKQVDCS